MTEWAMPRRFQGALAALGVALAPAAGLAPAVAQTPATAPIPSVAIEGKGYGHGVGMAQDGALAMASAGASAAAILSRFYPGTSPARRAATVRVAVYDAPAPAVVTIAGGGEIRDAPSGSQSPGFPVTLQPGGSASLAFDGSRYRVTPGGGASIAKPPTAPTPAPATTKVAPATSTTSTTNLLDPLLQALVPTTVPLPPPATTSPAGASATPPPSNVALTSRGLWVVPNADSPIGLPATGRSYRGVLVASGAGRSVQLTNELDVELYLRGMAEVPGSWPAAAVQAQAIAARTYAIRASAAGRTLCDDQQCQVYVGVGAESAGGNAAVAATRGQVLTYQGAPAETVYSASGGGTAATAEEGFGPDSPDLPYLRPVDYPTADPQPWATSLPLPKLAARFGYRGDVSDVRVSRTGPSGRPVEVTFDGAGGPMAVDAHRFWTVLQLRSSWFTLRIGGPGEPGDGLLSARLPDVAGVGRSHPEVLLARSVDGSLGRAPWVGLAALLLAGWATVVVRTARRRPATGTTT